MGAQLANCVGLQMREGSCQLDKEASMTSAVSARQLSGFRRISNTWVVSIGEGIAANGHVLKDEVHQRTPGLSQLLQKPPRNLFLVQQGPELEPMV